MSLPAGLPAKSRSSDRAGAVEAAAIAWKNLASDLQAQAVSWAGRTKGPRGSGSRDYFERKFNGVFEVGPFKGGVRETTSDKI